MDHAAITTLSLCIAVSVTAQWAAARLRIPPIVLFLAAGFLLGKSWLGVIDPHAPGVGFTALATLGVAVVVFEGALHLDTQQLRLAPTAVYRLVTLGAAVTWLLTTLAAQFLVGFDGWMSFLFASILIVTGPTVIQPLLSVVEVTERADATLRWESILIDAVGALCAVLALELFLDFNAAGQFSYWRTAERLLVGVGVGGVGAISAHLIFSFWRPTMRQEEELAGNALLAVGMGIFGIAESLVSESGLVALVVGGIVLGRSSQPLIHEAKVYKTQLSSLVVATVFVLIAASIPIGDVLRFATDHWIFLAVLVLIVRPASVWISTPGSNLTASERAFLASMAPRGVVAAAIATVFSETLANHGVNNADVFRIGVMTVIVVTVIVYGAAALPVARLFGVRRTGGGAIWVVGGNGFGVGIAQALAEQGQKVLVADLNPVKVAHSEARGVTSIAVDGSDPQTALRRCAATPAAVIAATENDRINRQICSAWAPLIGRANVLAFGVEDDIGDARFPTVGLPHGVAGSAAMLDQGVAELMVTQITPNVVVEGAGVLLLRGPRILRPTTDGPGLLLSLTPHLPWRVPRLLTDDRFIELPGAETVLDAALELGRHAVQMAPQLDFAEVESALHERELQGSTVLGGGAAVPHARLRQLEHPLLLLGRLRTPIPSDADAPPIQIVFLLLTPAHDHTIHLQILGELACLLQNVSCRDKALCARSAAECRSAIVMALQELDSAQSGEHRG